MINDDASPWSESTFHDVVIGIGFRGNDSTGYVVIDVSSWISFLSEINSLGEFL
jgi:hypothetical protein